jgi:hypothetical protein
MPWMRRRQLAWRLAMVTLAGTAVCVASAGGARADRGYGPPAPATEVPGGYYTVVTSQTVTSAGGKIGPVSVGGLSVTLTVPAGAFSDTVQITLTGPNVAGIGDAGFSSCKAVGGVGVLVQQNGSKYSGKFAKPLTLSMASGSINALSVVVRWNGTAFVTESGATVRSGSATVSVVQDPNFAVLAPSAIPGATKAATGKPFLGEEILAGILLLLGISGLAAALRWRAVT